MFVSVYVTATCTLPDGSTLAEGGRHVNTSSEPCSVCTCSSVGLECSSELCLVRPCPSGMAPVPVPGTCCSTRCEPTTECRDENGAIMAVGAGFTSRYDPCMDCTCTRDGLRCMMAGCVPETCPGGTQMEWIPDRCCERRWVIFVKCFFVIFF